MCGGWAINFNSAVFHLYRQLSLTHCADVKGAISCSQSSQTTEAYALWFTATFGTRAKGTLKCWLWTQLFSLPTILLCFVVFLGVLVLHKGLDCVLVDKHVLVALLGPLVSSFMAEPVKSATDVLLFAGTFNMWFFPYLIYVFSHTSFSPQCSCFTFILSKPTGLGDSGALPRYLQVLISGGVHTAL